LIYFSGAVDVELFYDAGLGVDKFASRKFKKQ